MTQFPTLVPVDALLVLKDSFTGKNPPVDQLGLAAWNVAGFGLGLALPPAVGSFPPNSELAIIETVLVESREPIPADGSFNTGNPLAWLALIDLALEILKKLRAK
jgi:hypothetical protein